jgi:hypothetical protein
MLLLLKKYLREAYRLSDERVLAFAPNNAAVRKVEEKALASKVCELPGCVDMWLGWGALGPSLPESFTLCASGGEGSLVCAHL